MKIYIVSLEPAYQPSHICLVTTDEALFNKTMFKHIRKEYITSRFGLPADGWSLVLKDYVGRVFSPGKNGVYVEEHEYFHYSSPNEKTQKYLTELMNTIK